MSAPVSLSTPEPGERAVALVHPHMRALDGIRFIAAFCVLAGHGYGYVVLQPSIPATDPISTLLVSLPGLGMTLFFVLSGFVIHYNYHRTVGIGSSGNGDFFIARFSRLYPLFLAVFAIEFIHMLWLEGYLSGAPLDDFDLFGPLPFFLSFTQTWLFIPFDGHPLYEHYGWLSSDAQATGAMWSLSVEALFYLVYPLFSIWLVRRRGKSLLAFAGAVAAVGIAYYAWGIYHVGAIQAWGIWFYGTASLGQSFAGWVVFYSPVGRFSEFLLGAAAAQYYLSRPVQNGVVARWPNGWTSALLAGIAVWLIATRLTGSPLGGVNASIAAAAISGFVLLAVLHRTWASRLMSSRLLVKGGEASYSLYLLHWYTMQVWAAPRAAGLGTLGRIAIYLAGIALSLALARAVYLLFERPALRWLRAHFRPLRLHVVLGSLFVATTLLCLVVSLHTHAAGHIPH